MTFKPSLLYQRIWRFVILLSGLVFWVTGSHAACSATVAGVSFGNYDVFTASSLDSAGNIRVDCDLLTWTYYVIRLGPGNGSYVERQMQHGSHVLAYNLYTNSSRSQVWGDGNGGTASVNGRSLLGSPGSFPVYGRIPAGQNTVVGHYTDTLVVTVEY
ncbi:Csu type fimbrial protein [Oceanimonas marisflavi]|uniref:Csu type fimbrial protein n=1 Tax=Oceanimonas marisflavi TaxID=2059724 RepID=UPI000D30632A|nr:spore coat U domain-containing protein [Oceanimonas marisflavi]